jgi:hypothetical protein
MIGHVDIRFNYPAVPVKVMDEVDISICVYRRLPRKLRDNQFRCHLDGAGRQACLPVFRSLAGLFVVGAAVVLPVGEDGLTQPDNTASMSNVAANKANFMLIEYIIICF